MDPSRQARALALLDAALQRPSEDRPALLEDGCAGDAALRREVDSLLALEPEAEDFLADGAGVSLLAPGARAGRYRIVELLGRGGMGEVYKAELTTDLAQQVAVKVLSGDLMSRSGLRRFRREREILGRLEHPNIARLVAGGTMEDGRPYLAMEYVDGTPLDVYCEARDLSAREVLELALPVCSALAHAHRNRIVHRDLKPGNVLVTGDGVPKLLDFGIAKLLGPAEEPADATDPRERPMTPHYASPEQVRHEPVTPASDLYSFGVLLYRLLTGRLPCGIDSCTYAEAVRRICEEEPLAPSALAATALPPSFAGDLDAIVFKALRKEPYRRYASMGRLAADIRRCLAGRPVVARRETPGHRGGKRLHRHRFLLTAALAGLAPAALLLLRERKGGSAGRRRTTMPPGKPAAEPDPHTELLAALSLLDHRLGSLERALLRLRMPRPAGDGRIADAEP